MALLLGLVVAGVVEAGFWAHAQNVATAAAQEAARVASAQGGDLDHGLALGITLLQAGLGPSARMVTLTGSEDASSVTVVANGGWPLGLGPDSSIELPLQAEVRVLREAWAP